MFLNSWINQRSEDSSTQKSIIRRKKLELKGFRWKGNKKNKWNKWSSNLNISCRFKYEHKVKLKLKFDRWSVRFFKNNINSNRTITWSRGGGRQPPPHSLLTSFYLFAALRVPQGLPILPQTVLREWSYLVLKVKPSCYRKVLLKCIKNTFLCSG